MKQRGNILRDTQGGSGLISVNGRQVAFQLEGVWRSESAPAVNMTVEVEFDDSGALISMSSVDSAQLAREQAEAAMAVAREHGDKAFASGKLLAASAVARFGLPTLIAIGALGLGWWCFNTLTIQIKGGFNQSVSFWSLMSVLNNPSMAMQNLGGGSAQGSAGIYGLLTVLALFGPFAGYFFKKPVAQLGACLPLGWILAAGASMWIGMRRGLKQATDLGDAFGGAEGRKMADEMLNQAIAQLMQSVSFGFGFYLALGASVSLCVLGLNRYRKARM